jgi:hypothetical protein
MKTSFIDRIFQLWEYKVSHGSLLIRSPKGPGISQNIDLVCVGVEYVAAPTYFRGFELQEPTSDEVKCLCHLLGKAISPERVRIVVSMQQRFPIVAVSFRILEHDSDIFDSPFA